MASPPLRLEVCLLSGRTESIHAEGQTFVRQLMLDAGQLLQVSIASLSRADGRQLEEMMTIKEAALEDGEFLQATVANVRAEMVGEALYWLNELDRWEDLEDFNHPSLAVNEVVYHVAHLQVEGPEEMTQLFYLILNKAFKMPQAAIACTDMMCGLKERYPTFELEHHPTFELEESENETKESMSSISSTRLLLNLMQDHYSRLFDDHNDQALEKKNWCSGWMQIFGHLVMRRLIPVKVVSSVMWDMIGKKDEDPQWLPEESMLQCVCEFVELCGEDLHRRRGFNRRDCVDRLFERLAELEKPELACLIGYSSKIRRRIRDLITLREWNWGFIGFG